MRVEIGRHEIDVDADRVEDGNAFLARYRLGEPLTFDGPVDLSDLTSFQRNVLAVVRTIPYGETVTYGELAERMGIDDGARAVAGACAANPAPVFVPCHRVVAEDGLGGYVAGKDAKQALLEHEGATGSDL